MRSLAYAFASLSFVFFFQIYPHYVNPNESARFLLTAAIVDDHTFAIDRAIQRYGDTRDKSIYNGRFYIAKPIGSSLLAAPFYQIFQWMGGFDDVSLNIWALRFFLNLLPFAFFIRFFHTYVKEKIGLQNQAFFLTGLLLFGTLFYTYAQLLMSHLIAGIMWFVAFFYCTEKNGWKSSFLAGALLGFCFVIEMMSVIPMAVLGLYLLLKKRSMMWSFAAAAFLFSTPQFLYNWYVFGGPLEWTYKHTYEFQQVNAQGYTGLLFPRMPALIDLLFGARKGFFYHMPHLVFGLAGFLAAKERRGQALAAAAIVVGGFLFVSGMVHWEGGWGIGPRYTVPVIPFLVYGTALWMKNTNPERTLIRVQKYLLLFLTALAVPFIVFGTVTWPFSPWRLTHTPVWENITYFWRGFFGLNIGSLLGFPDSLIRVIVIIMVVLPLFYFAYRAFHLTKELLVFSSTLILVFLLTLSLQPYIERRTDASHCFSIARAGFSQGNYAKAEEFFRLTLDRRGAARYRQQVNYYLGLIGSSEYSKNLR